MNTFYGDRSRWFIAKVINNLDPEERGRVQIRIYGVHTENYTDLPNFALPWAEVMLPSTEGGVSGIGRIPQIQNNALVFGIFLDGPTSQSPLVLGSLNQFETPSFTQRNRVADRITYDLGTDGVRTSDSLVLDYNNGNANLDQRRLLAMRFFVDNGLSPTIAAGICGNLEAESNFRTEARFTTSREDSFGIAQWNSFAGRYQKLLRYAERVNEDTNDFFFQLSFVLHELAGKSVNNDGGGDFNNVYNRLLQCNTFEGGVSQYNSTWIFCRYYEIPADPEGKLPRREQFARVAFEQFNDSITTASPSVS